MKKYSEFSHNPGLIYGREFEDFLKRYVFEHFAFESREVFPVLVRNSGDGRLKALIAALQEEHEEILGKASALRKLIKNKEQDADVLKMVKDVFLLLLEHAAKEDDELLPAMEEKRGLF